MLIVETIARIKRAYHTMAVEQAIDLLQSGSRPASAQSTARSCLLAHTRSSGIAHRRFAGKQSLYLLT